MQVEEFEKVIRTLMEEEDSPGAYECTSLAFGDIVHIVYNMTDRTKEKMSILSCTMSQEGCMDSFQPCLKILRKSDFYTRSSKNQILLLLLGSHPDQGEIVAEKLKRAWSEAGGDTSKISFSVYRLENDEVTDAHG